MKRIHIVGAAPRTGTTLLTEAMIACFKIDLYTSHESTIFQHTTRDGTISLTKDPQDITVVGTFLRIMPELYVIYLVRDPRDIITSKHSKDPDRYWWSLSSWKAWTRFGRKLKDHPRFITIRYEDLVGDPDGTQRFLMKRMPFLVKKAPFSRYHEISDPSVDSLKALGGIRPISPARIGRWRNHLPRLAGQLLRHEPITQDLIEFGYETDDAWLSELEGVDPDFRESSWPEYDTKAPFFRRLFMRWRWRWRKIFRVSKGVMKLLLLRCGVEPSKLKLYIFWKT